MIHINHIQATEGSKPPMIFISSVYEGWSVAPIESKIMFQSSIFLPSMWCDDKNVSWVEVNRTDTTSGFSAHRITKSSTGSVFTLSSYL